MPVLIGLLFSVAVQQAFAALPLAGLRPAQSPDAGGPTGLLRQLPGPSFWLPVLGAMALGVLLQSAWLSLLLLVALPFGPRVSAALAQRRHRQALAQQMPTLVEALAAALRAGQSLPQALESAQDDLPAPGGAVVAGILRDVRLGEAPETVLERVAAAFGETPLATDWRLMATAVAIQRSSGGNLAEILDQLGETLRERQRLQAQVDALTAQGRLSAWVVGGLPPLLLLALQLLDPQLVAPLFQTPTGWVLLGLGALLEACGILILRRIVDINA